MTTQVHPHNQDTKKKRKNQKKRSHAPTQKEAKVTNQMVNPQNAKGIGSTVTNCVTRNTRPL